uniref:Legume lectin domain-containing protein n=1 Tax=Oryza glaberrima TaxID=4538 RepID=I1P9G3_ORYGL
MATIRGKFGIIMVAMILVVRIIAFASASDNDELPALFNILQQKPGKAAQLLCASGPRQTSLCLPMVTVKLWNANHKSRSPSTSNSGLILSQANRIEVRVGYQDDNGVKASPICFVNLLPSVAPPLNEASIVGGEVKGLSNGVELGFGAVDKDVVDGFFLLVTEDVGGRV